MPGLFIKNGERRNATLLFADMKGFTHLSEYMDPEEMDSLMNKIFGTFEEIIQNYGGYVEKYIGDALVAVFGVKELHDDDPFRAVKAALEFLHRIKNLALDLKKDSVEFAFRIGIHYGQVATGKRGKFDVVTGHAMAIAQRLEAAAEPNSILVSDAVYELCKTDFAFTGPFSFQVKGKLEPITAWKVEINQDMPPAIDEPFIGRKEILDELVKIYIKDDNKVVTGRYILAETGSGKTRLIQAFIERITHYPDFNAPILKATAQRFRTMRYATVLDIITGYLGLDSFSSPEIIEKHLLKIPGIQSKYIKDFLTFISEKETDSSVTNIVLTLFAIFSCIMDQYENSMYSCLIFIDNAQDLDRLSREFFKYYFKNGKIKPFIIMSGKEYPQKIHDAFPEIKLIKLPPLTPDETKELIHYYWPECPENLQSLIIAQSLGMPLFIKEYTLYAKKHKDLSHLPETIQNIFLSSLQRYNEETREFIKKVSVFLHHFSESDSKVIIKKTGGNPDAVPEILHTLVQDGILIKEGDFYRFSLDVHRKAVYDSLLNHNKKIIHGIIADLLIDRPKHNKVRLIIHLIKSDRWNDAAQIMLKDPLRTYMYEYLNHIDIIYKNLEKNDKDTAIQLLILKSAMYFNSGKIEDAENELKRIMKIAITEHNDTCMGFAYHMICAYNVMSYALQKAVFTGEKAIYYYTKDKKNSRSIQNILRYLSFSEAERQNFKEATELIESMKQYGELDLFEYNSALADLQTLSGEYTRALKTIESLTDSEEEYSHFVARFFGLDLKLKILWQLCDFENLGKESRRLIESRMLSESSMAQAYAMLAASLYKCCDADAATENFLQADYYIQHIKNDFDRVDALRTLSLCQYVSGNLHETEVYAQEALALGLRHSCYYPTFTVLMVLVQIYVDRNNSESAKFYLTEASYFLSTGFLLPAKDLILYYYYAAILGTAENIEKFKKLAWNLLQDEKARIQTHNTVKEFLSIRHFNEIDSLFSGAENNER
ncbi:MAG TPA: adenylate/guanylate cyclase domain-containing protein [Spirochaetales bacterium]|nr:adenylate/guanylate cyclase domain-containing protein [Spirochaetales bacterium]